MERAKDVLPGALRLLDRNADPLDLLAAAWPVLVGVQVAAHTRPVRLQEGSLEVAVDSAEWLETLKELAPRIQEQAQQIVGPGGARTLHFRLHAAASTTVRGGHARR
jgi:predicted nucleic acid-binding Zn ribbon protein